MRLSVAMTRYINLRFTLHFTLHLSVDTARAAGYLGRLPDQCWMDLLQTLAPARPPPRRPTLDGVFEICRPVNNSPTA